MNFSEAKHSFDTEYKSVSILKKSFTTVDGKFINDISIIDKHGNRNEEYYKWQFIYSLIKSDLISRDYIGAEIYFPKGNIGSAPIKIDAVVFKDIEWLEYYNKYRKFKDQESLDKVRKSAIFVIEFKRDGDTKKIEQIFNSQIKASIKEPDTELALGAYYDKERLYLFKRIGNDIQRLDNSKNFPTSQRILEQLQLEITDPYFMIPNLDLLQKLQAGGTTNNIANRVIEDLNIVYTMNDENIKLSLSNILKTLDSVSLFNEEGYHVLIQMLAIKIFDEKQADLHGSSLKFYIKDAEHHFQNLQDEGIQEFIKRTSSIHADAKKYYKNILSENKIVWKNSRHVRVASEIAYQFQHYSFVKSRKSDLYQLVFYNFATKFKKDENAQFLTPIPIIEFLVKMINPRRNESVCDPCCGIGDFLSVSYVNSEGKLDDNNLYGLDNDHNMTILAQLNMLLNGDGNATIKYVPEKGSINQKLTQSGAVVTLNKKYHASGDWDNWPDETELMKFDIILTNPPFGKGRSLNLSKSSDVDVAEFYETYDMYIKENPKAGLDLGVVFLENAIRLLKHNGRFGIILSNSIASNKSFEFARKWLLKNIRVVAIIDMPENVFAETGVNTTIIMGYKVKQDELNILIDQDYKVFSREIKNVGYIKKTANRNVFFETKYKLDENTFETIINEYGESVSNEDFSVIIEDFKEWCLFQEATVKKLYLS